MRKLTEELSAHINSEVTTLASCVKIKLVSGKIITLTDSISDIIVEGLTFKATGGFNATSMSSSDSLSPLSMYLDMVLSDDAINEEELSRGDYDYSEISIFIVDYNNPNSGKINIAFGYLGEINIIDSRFSFEVRNITEKLGKLIGSLYSPTCRARFGDSKCKVNANLYSKTGIITKINNIYSFTDDSRDENIGYYNLGIVEFIDSKIKLEIKDYGYKKLEFFLPLPKDIKIGDKYIITPGCDKAFSSCRDKYSNVLNFRGEPHVPGSRYMLETVTTRI